MKKIYEELYIEFIEMTAEDIIMTSESEPEEIPGGGDEWEDD